MDGRLRQSMAWLHTWAGVVLGSVLMVVFFMGTLAVFDREIDRWMMPGTRLSVPAMPVSIDRTVRPVVEQVIDGRDLEQWYVVLPNARVPAARIQLWDRAGEGLTRYMDVSQGTLLPDGGTLGGTEFFYRFHYSLHLTALDLGYWIVGLASMAMLAGLVSGVIIHVRIFKDLFAFRPWKPLQRSLLDVHNLAGVLALPFHVVITLSGLIIFFSFYMPASLRVAYGGDSEAFAAEAFGAYSRPKAGRPGELASLDHMVAEARRRWGSGEAYFVRVWHPGDANAVVEVRRRASDRIRLDEEPIYFDGASGAVLKHERLEPVAGVHSLITGLHFIPFEHRLLRWLYFVSGVCGCVLIGTGLLYWVEKRKARHAEEGRLGAQLVEALACFSIAGLVMATVAMLVANRVLPLWMPNRAQWEVAVFFSVWCASGVHAWQCIAHDRARTAWRQQCIALCALACAAAGLNWLTTGDHLLHTLSNGRWAVAGVDGVLLVGGTIAGRAAVQLWHKHPAGAEGLSPDAEAGRV